MAVITCCFNSVNDRKSDEILPVAFVSALFPRGRRSTTENWRLERRNYTRGFSQKTRELFYEHPPVRLVVAKKPGLKSVIFVIIRVCSVRSGKSLYFLF